MSGFHNSFDDYLKWHAEQVKKGLKTLNWGDWWEQQQDLKRKVGDK